MPENEQLPIRHNKDERRFEVEVDGHTGQLDYERWGDTINFVHTGVPKAIGGRGIAGQLAEAGLHYARDKGLTVRATCPFVSGYIKRHPEYQPLLASKPKA